MPIRILEKDPVKMRDKSSKAKWITKKPKSWITKKPKKMEDKETTAKWITKKGHKREMDLGGTGKKKWITKKKPKKRQHKGISEKSHSQVPKKYPADKHGRFKGKVFDASPIQLAKSGMTESKRYGTPIYSRTFQNGKLTKVGEGTGGTTKTSFKGWNKKDSKGLSKGGRAGFQHGGRTRLLEELGRVEAEPSNRNRRAEISRVHGELNRGYKDGGSPHTKDRLRPPRKKFITGYGSKGTSRRAVEGIKRGYKSGGAVLKGKKVGIQIK